jgi:monoamine oxidase
MSVFNRSTSKAFKTTMALALFTLSPFSAFGMAFDDEVEIVIVGGGLSGLTAAHALKKSGVNATLFEGRSRLGGRTHTHYFDESKTQFFEEGGTFIDDDHLTVISLAQEMGVELTHRGYGTRKITSIHQEKHQDEPTLLKELEKVYMELSQLVGRIDWNEALEYDPHTQKCPERPLYPHLSGLSDFGKSFIQTYYEDEMGRSINKASIYQLKWLLKKIEEYKKLLTYKNIPQFPKDKIDESVYDYTVAGGMSTLINSVASHLDPEHIHLGHKLTRVQKDGKYILTFQTESGTKQIRANYVIMTLPFSTLRHVTIDESVALRDDQKQAIQTLSYGSNSKIGIPVESPTNLYNDLAYYYNFDTMRCGWPGHNAFTLMVNAGNGENGENLDQDSASHIWNQERPLLQQAYPSIHSFGGLVIKNWAQDLFSLGSYSGFTDEDNPMHLLSSEIAEFEGMRQFAEPTSDGHFFFAGDHTRSDDSAAHIEGAVRSGYKAAELLINSRSK